MLPLGPLSLALTAALMPSATAAGATTICSPSSCTDISTPLSNLPQLGGSSSNDSIFLLPGTYGNPLPPALQANASGPGPLAGLKPFNNYTLSRSASPFHLLPSFRGVRMYEGAFWSGGQSEGFAHGWAADNATLSVRSLIVSPETWLKLRTVEGNEHVIWSSLADLEGAPLSFGPKKGFKMLDIQSAACAEPCAAGGSCTSQDILGRNGTCVCSLGFSGPACEECAPGHWGPDCLDCASHCRTGKCNDGLLGNGQCAATPLLNLTTTCNCLNGQCTGSTSSSTCTCSPGWASPRLTADRPTYATVTNHLQCSICAAGFTSSGGECIACGPHATACSSDRAAMACVAGFEVELGRCISSNGPSGKGSSCSGANFWDATTSSCSPCSPTCGETCFGSSSAECLSCSAGKGLLQGHCVDVDSSTQTCDQASAGFGATQGFWLDPAIGACDTCPAKSTGCVAPGASRAKLRSTACLDGYLLSTAGVCVESCPSGSYRDGDSSVCHACSAGCVSCEGYASYCTACPSNQLAMDGSCVSNCVASTFANNGTCTTCHGDCATCSGPSFDGCLSCSPSRPVLSNGRCLPVCGRSQFFDAPSGVCRSCDNSCSSCTGPSATECLSCDAAGIVASSGTCDTPTCSDTFVPFLAICLETFIASSTATTATTKKAIHVLTILIPLIIIIAVVAALLFIKHERKRTREATERWAAGMDDIQVQKTTESVFGRNGVEGVLAFMGRTRADLEQRWKERSDVKRVRARQRGLKPLTLAANWKTKEDAEQAYELQGQGTSHGRNPRHQPPPYTPSAVDDDRSSFLEKTDKRSLRSHSDDGLEIDHGRSTRPQSRYTIDSSNPSPSYESLAHSQRNMFTRDSITSAPDLASPAPAAYPRPSHFRSQTSLAPTSSRYSSRRRSIDLEEESFLDFQTEYSTVRQHPTRLDPPRTPCQTSRATTRLFENEALDLDDTGRVETVLERPAIEPFFRIDSPGTADSPASFESQAVIRSHYWLVDALSEGGRSEQEIRFAPSPSPSTASTAGGQPRLVGGNNPFRSVWL